MWLFIISLLDYKLQENSNYICFLFYYDHISTCLVENKYLSKNELNEMLLKYSPLLSWGIIPLYPIFPHQFEGHSHSRRWLLVCMLSDTDILMSFSPSIRQVPLFFISYTVENVDFEILFSFLFECFPHHTVDHVMCSFKKIINRFIPNFCVCSWFCVPLSNYACQFKI